jgi:hypothetical protein
MWLSIWISEWGGSFDRQWLSLSKLESYRQSECPYSLLILFNSNQLRDNYLRKSRTVSNNWSSLKACGHVADYLDFKVG